MARIDNNNRLTPDAVRDYDLNPSAAVVDKQSKYTPQLQEAAKLKQTAESLSRLAKGLTDANYVWQKQANENAIVALAEQKGEENKKAWADVSHNLKGMAKFNPYNEDAYNALVAGDIGKKYINSLYADPELKYRSPEEVYTMIDNLQNDMLAEFSSAGLNKKHYANPLINFKTNSDRIIQQHASAYAEVKMQRTDNQISTTYSNYLLEGGQENFSVVLDNVVQEGKNLGRTTEGNANNILNTIQKAVATDPSKYSTSFVLAQLKTYKINGKTLTELIPNLDGQVLKIMREAKTAEYQDLKLQLEHENLQGQLAINQATNDFLVWSKENPYASQKEKEIMFEEISDKYELQRFQIGFASGLAGYQANLFNLTDIKTDPEVFEELKNKANKGELSVEDMNRNMPYLSNAAWKQLNELITKETSNTVKFNTQQFNDLYLDNDAPNRLRGELYNKAKIDLNTLNDQLNNKEITPSEYKRRFDLMRSQIEHQRQVNKNTAANVQKLIKAQHRNMVQITPETEINAEKNFARFGMLRNTQGVPLKTVDVLSMPSQNRGGRVHVGYDINNVHIGQPIYPPKGLSGKVVGKGFEETMGNYIILSLKNGKYCLIQHLKDTAGLKYNDTFNGNTVIGHVGNTGRAANNGSLHVEFWDKNCMWINTQKF